VIVFSKLSFKNFFSSGNQPVTFDLNSHKTTLVYGINGSGKSTILDALCYCLFGRPFRSINLPQLINSKNKKDLLTETEFSIGKSQFLVRRGMKPKIFEIYKDGELIDAAAADKDNQKYLEQNILKMNQKTFMQVVILGSSNFIPFMQLNNAGRRECIEDFLDIKVFSTMSVLAKDRLRRIKEDINQKKGDISNLTYKIDLQEERLKEISERSQSDISNLKEEIIDLEAFINYQTRIIVDGQSKDTMILQEVKKLMKGSPKKMVSEFQSIIAKMDGKIERLVKDSQFYENNDVCPSCTQEISESVKQTMCSKNNEESNKLSDAKKKALKELDKFQSVVDLIQSKEEESITNQNELFRAQTKIDNFNTELTKKRKLLSEAKEDSSVIDYEKGKLQVLKEQLEQLNSDKVKLVEEQSNHEVIVNLLKESGVKAQIVKKYLPVMNKYIRKYLTDLEFPIFFTLDEEFNEEVQSPFHQNFSYSSFSEGQKARIDLSLMLTWREIGKLKNSVSTNILILDEVFSSSLDETGKQNLLQLLRYGLDDRQRIVVVDHTLSQNFKEKFDHSVEVTMQKGFSDYAT
jgi:DNA repair exonuclease SbcCD ATPase subunit